MSSLERRSIQVLPPELLLHIFALYVERPYREQGPPGCGIAKLMLVCSYWRALILDTSTFWNHISTLPSLCWLTLCLERSRNCTLDLDFLMNKRALSALELILSHTLRIRSITTDDHIPGAGEEWMLRVLFDAGMPLLERLELSTNHGLQPLASLLAPGGKSEAGVSSAASSQWPLVKAHISSIRAPLWRGLRVLKLIDVSHRHWRRDPCTCAISHFLHIIAHNSLLEELSLRLHDHFLQALPARASAGSGDGAGPSPLLLGRLRSLFLQGSHSFVSGITRHLEFPRDIPNVELRVQHTPSDDALTESAVSDLLLPRFRAVLERMTDVVLAGDSSLCQTRLYSPRPPWPPTCTGKHEERLFFSWEDGSVYGSSAATVETQLRGLARAMATMPVRRLTLKVSLARLYDAGDTAAASALASAFWATIFDAFSSIEQLCVLVQPVGTPELRLDVLELLRALRPATSGSGEDGEGCFAVVRCPLLTRLSIHGEFGQDAGESREALEALAEFLGARASGAARVEELDLHFWHRDRDELERPLSGTHRAFLSQARGSVESFKCKFGISAGCRSCR